MIMKIYHYHPDTGIYAGEGVADESPLEPGVWLVPANATTNPPPSYTSGAQFAIFTENSWQVQDIPSEPEEVEPTSINTPPFEPSFDFSGEPGSIEYQRKQREFAFKKESDPIFFQAQRNEATMEEWLAKVDEIRQRFPYPPISDPDTLT